MYAKMITGLKPLGLVLLALLFCARAPFAFPIHGGEHVLFIGNSLTGMLYHTVPDILESNGYASFEGHAVQIWNQTLETHWNFAPETHADLCHATVPSHAKGYIIKGAATVWKKGQYNDSSYYAKGYLTALEVIRNGTPDNEPWDYVILQGYRVGDSENKLIVGPDGMPHSDGPFFTYAVKFIDAIREAGAEPLLYENWVVNPDKLSGSAGVGTNHPYWINHSTLTEENYHAVSEVKSVPIVPVGEIMHRLSSTLKPAGKSDGWLYRDNVHPNSLGKAMQSYAFASFFSGVKAGSFAVIDTTIATVYDAAIKMGIDEILRRYQVDISRHKGRLVSGSSHILMAVSQARYQAFNIMGRTSWASPSHEKREVFGSQVLLITNPNGIGSLSNKAALQVRIR